ncbi:MAG: aldehyde dehydrogenase (NADP(+)) [Rhodothermales bacterium]
MTGQQFIAGTRSAASTTTFTATNPATSQPLPTAFHEATAEEVDRALKAAFEAFQTTRTLPPKRIAAFLDAIADEIMATGDALIERATAETGLPNGRFVGERGRTVNQLRLFAQVVREGSWVDARIDTAQPERAPIPKPDLRLMKVALGPVVVFGASNFPLAFSVAGGDTASALAAGCPVVVKAHPAHPGTCELVAEAITRAAQQTGMPTGVFSMLHGQGHEVGMALVEHAYTAAVGFTGSLRGGRALFDAANRREVPIPVFAEMGSTNPVFVLPEALAERREALAQGLVNSVTLGVGQFCTNPGLVVGQAGESFDAFADAIAEHAASSSPGTMLHEGIRHGYDQGVAHMANTIGVAEVGRSSTDADQQRTEAAPALFRTDGGTFASNPHLHEEVFGPASLLVACDTRDALLDLARNLDGHLTATLHGTEADLQAYRDLIDILTQKVGRLVINGFPTGVEVCPSMHHGGPYPASTDSRFTSVGTAAIQRFARPICYQNLPDALLPPALQNANPLEIWRLVNNGLTQDAIS